jgi:hypothetical protein
MSEGNPGLLVEAQDLGGVLRLARVVLLPVGQADLWIGGHDDARLGAVHPRFPRTCRGDDLPVLDSLVFSPMYQTFPHRSCAYQSKVFSINSPCSVTLS